MTWQICIAKGLLPVHRVEGERARLASDVAGRDGSVTAHPLTPRDLPKLIVPPGVVDHAPSRT